MRMIKTGVAAAALLLCALALFGFPQPAQAQGADPGIQWINMEVSRVLTYYGEWRQGDHGIDYFRELTKRVVELDPHFVDAYRFGALVLADDLGHDWPELFLSFDDHPAAAASSSRGA